MTRIARVGFARWLRSRNLSTDPIMEQIARAYSAGATTPERVDVVFAEYSRHYRMKLRRAVRRYDEFQAEERARLAARNARVEVAA